MEMQKCLSMQLSVELVQENIYRQQHLCTYIDKNTETEKLQPTRFSLSIMLQPPQAATAVAAALFFRLDLG